MCPGLTHPNAMMTPVEAGIVSNSALFCICMCFSVIQLMLTVLLLIHSIAEARFNVALGIQSDVSCKECNSGPAFGNPAWYGNVTTWSRRTPMEKFLRSEFFF
jgi:hypothetical protein